MRSTALTRLTPLLCAFSKLIDIQARHGRDVSLMGYVTGNATDRDF